MPGRTQKLLKNHLITLLVLALVPLLFIGCTNNDKSSAKNLGADSSVKNSAAQKAAEQEQLEKELLKEQAQLPTTIDNRMDTTQDPNAEVFRFSNEAQKFTLTKLGSLLNSEFSCKATLKLSIREKEEQGVIKLSFSKNELGQNEFKATWWPSDAGKKPFYIANKKEVCGEKVQLVNNKKAIGSLSKTNDQYVLQYTVDVLDPVSLKLKWHDQEAKPGEMVCETLSHQAIAKAKIESCQLSSLK